MYTGKFIEKQRFRDGVMNDFLSQYRDLLVPRKWCGRNCTCIPMVHVHTTLKTYEHGEVQVVCMPLWHPYWSIWFDTLTSTHP